MFGCLLFGCLLICGCVGWFQCCLRVACLVCFFVVWFDGLCSWGLLICGLWFVDLVVCVGEFSVLWVWYLLDCRWLWFVLLPGWVGWLGWLVVVCLVVF